MHPRLGAKQAVHRWVEVAVRCLGRRAVEHCEATSAVMSHQSDHCKRLAKAQGGGREGNGQHPCVAVTPDNDATPLDGTKAEVSGMIVEICLKRHALWYVTLMTHLLRFIGQTRGHCWGAPTRLQGWGGVGAPRQCPLGWVASYLIYADVCTFRCFVVMMQVLAVASQQKRSTCDEERQCC